MKEVLLYIWQLPQNLVGLILLGYYKLRKSLIKWTPITDTIIYLSKYMPSGISLGNYIIFKDRTAYNRFPTPEDVRHEYGHHRQSLYLGPLYLLIIGLPSILGNLWDRLFHRSWDWKESYKWYYNQPWEKWADKLGGVQR